MTTPSDTPFGSVDSAQVQFQHLERALDAHHAIRGRGDAQQRTVGFSVAKHTAPNSPTVTGATLSPKLRQASGGDAQDDAAVSLAPALSLPAQMQPSEGAAAPSKGPPANLPPKLVLSKAERRELQERQRAAKASGGAAPAGGKPAQGGGKQQSVASEKGASEAPPVAKQHDTADATRLRKQRLLERTDVQKAVALFAHLPQYEREKSISLPLQHASQIHPTVAKLGLQYAEGVIQGANARCVAMLNAFKEVIRDYHTPPAKALNRDLESKLRPQIQYLVDCRPMGINMGNAIKWLKARIAKLPPHLSESTAKEILSSEIDNFINERITLAIAAISALGASKIAHGDVIITYGCAHVVEDILISAHRAGVEFKVVVLDARPHWEGRALWRRLVAAHLDVSYAGMHALSYAMRAATKVHLFLFILNARRHKGVDGGARLSLKRCRRIARRFCARCAVCFPRERACSHLLRDVQVRRTSHARLHLRERARRSGRPRHGSPLQACGDLRPGAPERRRPHHGGRAALEHARAAVGGRGRERQCAELAK